MDKIKNNRGKREEIKRREKGGRIERKIAKRGHNGR